MTTQQKVWFITGTSRGFGREWAEAALERGDRVAATARNIESLKALTDSYGDRVLALQLDVTDKAAVDTAVAHAHEHFGRLDVVVNNAGYGLFGTIEEVSEDEARAQIETNLFGALWVTKAALPILRAQGSGHFVQVSSVGGLMAFPNLGLYHASKWAVEAFSQSLALEVAPFGLHVTIVEPTGYSTDWSGDSAVNATPIDVYEPARAARAARVKPGMVGDPSATREAILAIVDADEPPLRVFFGRGQVERIEEEYGKRLDIWHAWKDLSERAHEARSGSSLVRAGVRPDGPRPVWCTQAPPPGGPLGAEPACVRLSRPGLSRCTATITGDPSPRTRSKDPAPGVPTALSGPTTRTGSVRSPRSPRRPQTATAAVRGDRATTRSPPARRLPSSGSSPEVIEPTRACP
ncbi:SDR family NAD(P)-dependent oxidoreductase [Streptomyces sp. WAC07094]|uniref:SDR family oxidoreductase n=1 Tax=Streptomyces sp. WAC07094 TaxID=3072183 RepID=UPI002EC45516|nr:SDR family NAD(P)-dependent oxidoreductase [Streptomyces sp. WAC07094]